MGVAPPEPRRFDGVPFRRFVELAVPEWKRLSLGFVFLIVGGGAALAYPQAIRIIVDEALVAKNIALVDMAAFAMLVIFLVQAVAVALRYILFTVAGERIVATLRSHLYERLLAQEIGFFDKERTGDLMNRLASDTTVLQNTVSSNISMALRNAVTAVGGIALLFYTSWPLTLVMLAVVPPVAIGVVWYGRRIRRLSREVQDALADASHVAEESLAGIRTVRSFVAEKKASEEYKSAVEHSFDLARQRARLGGAFTGISSFFGLTAAVIVLWVGGRMVVDGEMSVGELTAFLTYTVMVAVSLGTMSSLWADFMKASGAAERVFQLVDRLPKMSSEGARPPLLQGDVIFRGVTFAYPTRPDASVLDGVDLHVPPGKVHALVGPSGAGKSTVAALLGRLYDPDAGTIELDGNHMLDLDPTWVREQVGVVAQEPLLFSASIRENIRYGRPAATDQDVEAAARAANAHNFIGNFPDGYDTEVGERGVQLSGGQKQRVAIARAILKDPKILILDEATSALDAESEHLVKEALDHLMKNRTTIVIAHRLSTVVDADEVVVLDQGRVVQRGTHRALVAEDGLYRQLVERQFVTT
ncbi:MAG: ABC transporter transmembrane domain-containing protein [Myxococcota bacterium]